MKSKWAKIILRAASIILGTTAVWILINTSWPIRGKVIDQATNKPVEGALVTARWMGSVYQVVESRTSCYHLEVTTTDKNGVYSFKPWFEPVALLLFDKNRDIRVYKPGYTRPTEHVVKSGERLIRPHSGTSHERFQELMYRNWPGCGERQDRKLAAEEEEIYREMKSLAQSEDEIAYMDKWTRMRD